MRTKLKFTFNEDTQRLISHVHQDPRTRQFKGVGPDSPLPKKIVLVSGAISDQIVVGKLYDVEAVPMRGKPGFVVMKATLTTFKASVDLVIKRSCYKVIVSYGNKKIYFDPLYGKTYHSNTVAGAREEILKNDLIENKEVVLKDFELSCQYLLARLKSDGYIVDKNIH